MANQEQLDILKQGVGAWNQWRKKNPSIEPDLSGADLTDANLEDANFYKVNFDKAILRNAWLIGANLGSANLINADLYRANVGAANLVRANLKAANLSDIEFASAKCDYADMSEANLGFADFIRADFVRVNFTGANFFMAHIVEANLSNADLSNADLFMAHIHSTSLFKTNFSKARISNTNFNDVDLSAVIGFETAIYEGPSSIGIDTIYSSHGNIPEVFLRGIGVDDTFIEYIRSLVGKPIQYYSCFISYSSSDEVFARRLYADLQSNNVRCWFAPEDLKWGAITRLGIDKAIHMHDKLLLILSKHSIASGWVEREVKTALAREKKEKRIILFPVRVDRAIFDCPFDWATEIRHERNIGDFTRWKDHDEYQKAFKRLLRDLKAET